MVKNLPSGGILLHYHKMHYFAPNSEFNVISIDIPKHISSNPEHLLHSHKDPPQ